MDQETQQYSIIIVILILLAFFFVIESYIAHHNIIIGHSTSIIILVGILTSFLIKHFSDNSDYGGLLPIIRFNHDIYFDIILPFIIFSSGYNMRRNQFFKNIKSIVKYGFVVTILSFIIYLICAFYANKLGILKYINSQG